MSSAPASPSPQPATDTGARSTDRIVVYRHSNLFYWWPVWALGYLFALITYFQDQHLAIVPAGTVAAENRKVDVDGQEKMEVRNVLILDKGKKLWSHKDDDGNDEPVQPIIWISPTRTFGSIYVIILLIVTTITSVTIRGLWTVFMFVLVVALTFIFAAAGWWEIIFRKFGQLSIHINMGGYLLISTVLFILWLLNFLLLDPQTYMVFTPGQLRVRLEIGGEETVFDTSGMAVTKERADLFRHWVLGFGSGDLVVKPLGLQNPLLFPNVLGVGSKVTKIDRMMKEKVIVRAPTESAPPSA